MTALLVPDGRGFNGPGSGRDGYIRRPPTRRASTITAKRVYPFSVGRGLPPDGVPIGKIIGERGGATLCCDPLTWYKPLHLISSPSAWVMGLNGWGKALAVDTPIPTPDGWTTMGDLTVGDMVFDDNGVPVEVVATTEVMTDRPCYQLKFSTGEAVTADAEHLWVTQTADDRKTGRTGEAVTTTRIAATLTSNKQGAANHSVRVCGPVQYPKRDLLVAPYTLGAWLGDGTSTSSGFTNHPQDAQILDEIRSDGYAVLPTSNPLAHRIRNSPDKAARIEAARSAAAGGASKEAAARHFGVCRAHLIVPGEHPANGGRADWYPPIPGPPLTRYITLQEQLREIGVLGDKHIPAQYLTASVEQRMALLQGLMDTDGAIDVGNGRSTFAVTSERLARDVHELVLSLGIRANFNVSVARLNGRVIGPQFKVGFTTDLPVFRLRRKAERIVPGVKFAGRRYVTAVAPAASVPVRCIQVANPSGMFLASRSFIPTHNSSLIKRWIAVLGAWGVVPMVLSDIKGEYVDLIRQITTRDPVTGLMLPGQVIGIGPGRGYLNLLDLGSAPAAVARLGANTAPGRLLMADARRRRQLALEGFIGVMRGSTPDDLEKDLLSVALRILDQAFPNTTPLPTDLAAVFAQAPTELKDAALWRGEIVRYHDAVEHLERNIGALARGSGIAEPFSRHTTTPMRTDLPMVFDLSGISRADKEMRAATQLACWSYGFGEISNSHALSAAGMGSYPGDPHRMRLFMSVLDELWDLIRSGTGMVGLLEGLARLNRFDGLIDVKCSHKLSDDHSMVSAGDQAVAARMAEFSGFIATAAVPRSEFPALQRVAKWSDLELETLASWTAPPSWEGTGVPDGVGKIMVKVKDRPGIPCKSTLMPSERAHVATDQHWQAPAVTT